jgi:hypothetical protein
MLTRLKPYFLTLTEDEAEYVMTRYVSSLGARYTDDWHRSVEHLWHVLCSQGIYTSELASPLLTDPEARGILRKLLGAEV